jgi:protein SCO1/2
MVNGRTMRNGVRILVGLCILAVVGCRDGSGARQSGLPVISEVPDFTLTDQDGRPITLNDLRGRVWVADFIFTHCAGPCPRMSEQMSKLQGQVADLPDVRLVSFSVDPRRDTPEVLRTYAKRYGAKPGFWYFITGDKQAIFDLAIRGFKLSVEDETDVDPILHSTKFMLVDREGRIRGVFDGEEPKDRPLLERAIRLLLKESEAPTETTT